MFFFIGIKERRMVEAMLKYGPPSRRKNERTKKVVIKDEFQTMPTKKRKVSSGATKSSKVVIKDEFQMPTKKEKVSSNAIKTTEKTPPKTKTQKQQPLVITRFNYDSFFPHQAFMRNVANQSKKLNKK
jgi:hypothetical protein